MNPLAALEQVRAADVAPQRWRNGGGSTRELLAWPRDADWQVRISVAEIDADGPFSVFEGVERWFAVLGGAGVVLGVSGAERRLTPASAPLRFDGAQAPQCRLIDGATRDLNLMLRGGLRGTLERAVDGIAWHPRWRWRALFTAGAARLHAPGAASIELDAATLVYPLVPGPCRIEPIGANAPAYWIGADLEPA